MHRYISIAFWLFHTVRETFVLADYGFTDAIYVTGGNTGNTFWRNKQGEVQGAFAKDLEEKMAKRPQRSDITQK